VRTGGKGSGTVGVLFFGVFEGKEIAQQEIAIRDFPMRSEPFITRTRVRGSRGIGVRHFGFPAYKGITTGEVAKSRNATGPTTMTCKWRTGVTPYRGSELGRVCERVCEPPT
jgi:hypothetical protein